MKSKRAVKPLKFVGFIGCPNGKTPSDWTVTPIKDDKKTRPNFGLVLVLFLSRGRTI